MAADPSVLLVQILWRSTLIACSALAAAHFVGTRQPRMAHGILAVAAAVLLGLPLAVVSLPHFELNVAPVVSDTDSSPVGDSNVLADTPDSPWATPRYERRSTPWSLWLLVFYFGGVSIHIGRLARSFIRMHRMVRGARPAGDRIEGLAVTRGWPNPRCLTSLTVRVPCTTRPIKPVVLLPADSVSWSDERLAAVLSHEIAHVRHRDPLWSAISTLSLALFWFHPAVWLLDRRIRVLAEYASDDEAIRSSGELEPYVKALLAVATRLMPADASTLRTTSSMAAVCLSDRVERVLTNERSNDSPTAAKTFLASIAAACLLVSLTEVDFRAELGVTPQGKRLLQAAESESPTTRSEALYRLARWQGRENETAPILVRHMGDTTPVRTSPSWDFATEGWGPARAAFVEPSPAETAAIGLASMGSRAAPLLEPLLIHPDAAVRRNAAWALGELRHPRGISRRGIRMLVDATEDPDPSVRAAAAWALGDIGAKAAIPSLQEMLDRETNERARSEALASMAALGEGVSLETLRRRRDR